MSLDNDLRGRAIRAIYSAFDLTNSEKGSEGKLIKSEESILFGHGANIDSFELVGLVLSVESNVSREFGVAITLADEKAMSQRSSPFRTVATMADYIVQVIEEGKRG